MGGRVRGDDGERGVYAVLYAALVVVMIGMSALVVDLASLRESRRTDRAAADSAVLAGARFLNAQNAGGLDPRAACNAVWSYLTSSIVGLQKPSTACTAAPNDFPTAPTTCTGTQYGGPIAAGGGGGYTVTVSWPVTSTSPFMDPDLGNADVDQPFDMLVDGSINGCDRLGVAVRHEHDFVLGAVLDVSRGSTTSVSVARLDPNGGPLDEVAALNVLNKTDCQSLVTLGGGKVLVGPTVAGSVVVGPGILAVEANGNGADCGGQNVVIDPNTSSGGSLICASSVPLDALGTNCDGLGLIRSHALDPGGQKAYKEAAITNGNLKPRPVRQNGTYGWNPVTKRYGCALSPQLLTPCATPMPAINYINALKTALGGTGVPGTNYSASAAPYVSPYTAAFQAVPASVCANISTTITLAAGNWYANCHINVQNGGKLVVTGGTLVVEKGISIASGGCFVMNVSTCDVTLENVGTSDVTTQPLPTGHAIIYLRGAGCPNGGCFTTSGKTILPQTFVYSAADEMKVLSTDMTVWTAPGAGRVTSGRTSLEQACFQTATSTVNEDCLNSRFSRLTYWSEFAAPKTKPNDFAGQGALSVVGVFFMPRAYFDVSGGSAYTAASAQFWADKIRVNGGAFLGLRPDTRTSIATPTAAIRLIR